MCFSLFMVVLRSLNTTRESRTGYGYYAIGDGHRGQAAAISESTITNFCHAISIAVIGDGFWNNYIASVIRDEIIIIIFLIGYYRLISREVVINSVNFSIISTCHHGQKNKNKENDLFLHNPISY